MPYRRLSEQIGQLSDPQRSVAFVRRFGEAVREGRIQAAFLPERFTLPKVFRRQTGAGTYQREMREMIFEVTPDVEAWFAAVNASLVDGRTLRRVNPRRLTAEDILAGRADFRALAAQTRRELEARLERGHALAGRNRRGKGNRGPAARGGRARR